MKKPARAAVVTALALSSVALSCGLFRGAINSSPGVRWWLFSNFGASRMCPEMLKRGAPLKLVPGGNTIGRFYPNQCRHDVDDARQTITIQFAGTGYAWTPVAGRVGFSCAAAVEYRPDFRLTDDAMYVWARTQRIVFGPEFQIGAIEYKVADWAARSPMGYLANTFGSQIVSGQLTSGFTVVRTDQGDDFSVGILEPPARPAHPFEATDDDRYVFVNETAEIRSGQLDFLGPFEIDDTDQALFVRALLQGPAVDALVYPRATADSLREQMQQGTMPGPSTAPPITGFVIRPGAEQRERLRLPRGSYSIIIDNSNALGQVNPPWSPLTIVGGNAAVLSYSVELGEVD